jgi:exonuclease III
MTCIIKILTLNINGIKYDIKAKMLEELLWQQDVDIALLQEITTEKIHILRGYTTYLNEGTERRGTAIAVEGIHITDTKTITSGRGIAVKYGELWVLDLYASSGAEKKNEREYFFNTELIYILPTITTDMIIVWDFKCIN